MIKKITIKNANMFINNIKKQVNIKNIVKFNNVGGI